MTLALLLVFLTGTCFAFLGFWQSHHLHVLKEQAESIERDTVTVSPAAQDTRKQTLIPISISIPKLHMHAPVLPVGLDREGRMATIPNAKTIAWYEYGPIPGQIGNTILAGHRDWNGNLGSFWSLGNLVAGDIVRIAMSDGTSNSLKVISTHTYLAQSVPVEVMDLSGHERTTLVTCAGDFVRNQGGYQSRVVVILQKTND